MRNSRVTLKNGPEDANPEKIQKNVKKSHDQKAQNKKAKTYRVAK